MWHIGVTRFKGKSSTVIPGSVHRAAPGSNSDKFIIYLGRLLFEICGNKHKVAAPSGIKRPARNWQSRSGALRPFFSSKSHLHPTTAATTDHSEVAANICLIRGSTLIDSEHPRLSITEMEFVWHAHRHHPATKTHPCMVFTSRQTTVLLIME